MTKTPTLRVSADMLVSQSPASVEQYYGELFKTANCPLHEGAIPVTSSSQEEL